MYLNVLPKCSDLFVGRENELKKLEKVFSETNFFYVEGIPGIGKTSLLLKWANILVLKDEYKNKVLWMECRKDWTLDNIITVIDDWLLHMDGLSIKKDFAERTFEYREKLIYIIKRLNENRYIFFIDSFENINCEYAMIFIKTLINYLRLSHTYIISREPLSRELETLDIFRIRLKGLENKDSFLLIDKFFLFRDFEGIFDKESLMNISKKAKGHPLILKNLLVSITSGISTPEDIIKENDMEKYMYKIFFGKLIDKLNYEEKNLLEIISSCRISLSLKIIKEVIHVDNISQLILSLEDKMIIEKEQNDMYFVQPLLKEYIWHNLTENKKKNIHNILGEYFEAKDEFYCEAFYHLINGGQPQKAGNVFQNVMKTLCSSGHYEEILKKLDLLERYIPLTDNMKIMKADVLVIQGKYEQGLTILEDLKNRITDENFCGDTYYSLARLYMYTSHIQKAIRYCNKSLEIVRKSGDMEKTIKVINTLIIAYDFIGNSKKSDELFYILSDIAVKESTNTSMVCMLMNRVKNLFRDGNLKTAINDIEKCLEIGTGMNDFCFISWAINNKGKVLFKLRRYDEAYECFEKNLFLGKNKGDNLIVAYSYQWLGWICYEKGDMEKASECFEKTIDMFLSVGNKLCAAYGEYNLAHVWEEKGDYLKAIDLYSGVINTAVELSYKKLEIMGEIQIIKNRMRFKELHPGLKDILHIKKKISDDFIYERIEINIILADIYDRQNNQKEKDGVLNEALILSHKSRDFNILTKLFYLVSKISNKNKQERELMRKKAEENLDKLSSSEKRELERFLKEINKRDEKKFLVKMQSKEFIVSFSEVEDLRKRKNTFDFFLDLSDRFAFEKNRGEINIFRKKTLLSLLLLLINNSKGVTSEEIYKEVWGLEYDRVVSVADVRKYICRLRELIEPNKENFKYILHKEGRPGEKGIYYFSDKVNFCFIDEVI